MALLQLKQRYPHYEQFADEDSKIVFESFEVYTGVGDRVGAVQDVLMDEQAGCIRYLIVDAGKCILIPMGVVRFDYDSHRIYVDGLKQQQIDTLPEYKNQSAISQDYEEMVRKVFRPMVIRRGSQPGNTLFDRNTYQYEQDSALYTLAGPDKQRLEQCEQQLTSHRGQ
ncbi:PRC-barrel domain-containing protein [Oculatella sp. LEGE 06141]|uniref:PRC-barrel domain-containing protein n=1 Tax=Oculatella sp. LEGE 06141 TaxID=1828648 RepID=UPI0018801FA4|nr:PRC-barrel domain-containing protein [Oculatella sp. LEGE 06141]MBE9177210.1 PRC-barrel domain-containing protein [Oculatella sp. LEGE 06141]